MYLAGCRNNIVKLLRIKIAIRHFGKLSAGKLNTAHGAWRMGHGA
jgi:hypothetical protein